MSLKNQIKALLIIAKYKLFYAPYNKVMVLKNDTYRDLSRKLVCDIAAQYAGDAAVVVKDDDCTDAVSSVYYSSYRNFYKNTVSNVGDEDTNMCETVESRIVRNTVPLKRIDRWIGIRISPKVFFDPSCTVDDVRDVITHRSYLSCVGGIVLSTNEKGQEL